jgi:putative OPT family oligopeptide transporter
VKGKWVRFVGIGAVACAGIVTVARLVPSMTRSLAAVVRGVLAGRRAAPERVEAPPRTDQDVPGWVIGVGITAVVLAVVFIPGLLAGDPPIAQRLVLGAGVALLGVVFVAVASRIVGLIGVSSQPTSGICLMTLLSLGLIFTALDWTAGTAKLALLTAGTVVATAASKAGDISQDLKTGFLVGATPRTQQLGQYLGAMTACWAVAATILFIGASAKFGEDPAAPQATMMKTVIEGQLSGSLPWGLVLAGAGLAIAVMLAGLQGLAFAIGVYLPLSALTPIFLGGVIRRIVDARRGEAETAGSSGILAASGLVAGEGLAGVLIAGLVGGKVIALSKEYLLTGEAGMIAGLVLAGGVAWFLARAGRAKD